MLIFCKTSIFGLWIIWLGSFVTQDCILLLQNILRQFPDIDSLLSLCVQICLPTTSKADQTPTPSASANRKRSSGKDNNSVLPTLIGGSGCFQAASMNSNNAALRRKSTSNSFRPTDDLVWTGNADSEISSTIKSSINVQSAEARITRVIAIKSILDLVAPLRNVLGNLKSPLFVTFKEASNLLIYMCFGC